ncbi:MAG: hypothetical protein ACE5HX_09015 [bacterium]
MKSRLKIFTLFSLLVFCGQATAQIDVITEAVNQNLEAFFLNDFDINSPASLTEIFRIRITNNYDQPCTIQLTLIVTSERFGELARGRTNPFDVPPGPLTPPLTNRDLFSNSSEYRLVDYNLDAASKKLLRDILARGKLLSDAYTFTVEVNILTCEPGTSKSDQFQIVITNPTKLDLSSPGSRVTGNKEDCPKIYSPLPQFIWESDMQRFCVVIAEARPGEDPESVLNQDPRFIKYFVVNSHMDLNEPQDRSRFFIQIPSTSFQYPASGEILTLRPGKTYYWRVIGIVNTSSGDVNLESEIYCFQIAQLDQLGGRKKQFEFVLRNILGSDYEKIFGEGGELEGYHPNRVLLNGEVVTFGDLIRRMNELSSNYGGYHIE